MEGLPATDDGRLSRRALGALALLLVAFMLAVQFSTDRLACTDGFYHLKMAWLLRTEGPFLRSFPYMQHTVFQDHWTDLHFTLHLWQAPFTVLPLLTAAKLSAGVLGGLALASFALAARRLGLAHGWAWTLLLAGSSFPFLYRLSMPRAQAMSVIFLTTFVWLWAERRPRALFALAFLYAWSYQLCLLVVPLGLLLGLAERLDGRPFPRELLGWTAGGLAAGHVLNPFFPNDLWFVWWHVVVKTLNAGNLRVGGEWGAYDSWFLAWSSWPAWVAWLAGLAAALLAPQRPSTRTKGLFLVSLVFLGMAVRHKKFIEYWPVFALLFAASALDGWLRARGGPLRLPRPAAAALGLALLGLMGWTGQRTAQDIASNLDPLRYRGAARWLQAHTAPGSLVFTADWDDMPELFFYNHHDRYMVALDPHFMYLHDKDLYALWDQIVWGKVVRPGQFIRRRFGARWAFTDLGHAAFMAAADQDPSMRRAYADANCALYEVLDGPGAAEPPLLLEAESLLPPRASSGRSAQSQNLTEAFGAPCSDSQAVLYRAGAPGDFIELGLPLARAGRYRLVLHQVTAPDYGVVEATLDGAPLQPRLDGWSPYVTVQRRLLPGPFSLDAGTHALRLTVVDRHPAAAGYFVGLDAVRLVPVEE